MKRHIFLVPLSILHSMTKVWNPNRLNACHHLRTTPTFFFIALEIKMAKKIVRFKYWAHEFVYQSEINLQQFKDFFLLISISISHFLWFNLGFHDLRFVNLFTFLVWPQLRQPTLLYCYYWIKLHISTNIKIIYFIGHSSAHFHH